MTCTVSFSGGACDAGLLLLGPDPVVRLFRCVSPPVPLRLVRRCSPPSPCSWLDVPLVAFTPMRFLFWRRSVRLQFPRADFPEEHAEYPVSERKNTPPRRVRGTRARNGPTTGGGIMNAKNARLIGLPPFSSSRISLFAAVERGVGFRRRRKCITVGEPV